MEKAFIDRVEMLGETSYSLYIEEYVYVRVCATEKLCGFWNQKLLLFSWIDTDRREINETKSTERTKNKKRNEDLNRNRKRGGEKEREREKERGNGGEKQQTVTGNNSIV